MLAPSPCPPSEGPPPFDLADADPELARLCESCRDARGLLLVLLCTGEDMHAEEVAEYVLGLLLSSVEEDGGDEGEEDDEAVETMVELLSAYQHEEQKRSHAMLREVALRLFQLVRQGAVGQSTTSAQPKDDGWQLAGGKDGGKVDSGGTWAAPKPNRATASAARQQQQPQNGARRQSGGGDRAANGGAPAPSAAADEEGVSYLREIMPDATAEICAFVLRRCAGEREEAVDVLISTPLEALEKQRQAAEAAEADARKQGARTDKHHERHARKATLERNGAVRDYAADGEEAKLSAPRLPYAQSRKQALAGPKTKYLDGQAVATKGNDKFVVVDAKEEWDGGSRGRVKTKGKRGPGFV